MGALRVFPGAARPRHAVITSAVRELRDMTDEEMLAMLCEAPALPPEIRIEELAHLLARDGVTGTAQRIGWTPAQVQRAVLALGFAARRVAAAERKRQPVIASGEDLYRLLAPDLRGYAKERVVAVYCDGAKRFLAKEVCAYGDEGSCPFPLAHIVARSLDVGARYVAVGHNHPSGDPAPSEQDVEYTRHLAAVLRSAGVTLLDHVIFTERDFTSMRFEGLLDQ